ncbi:hypothetical protein NVP1022O_66 [Vibrio phage 1.022.O._10N.286.45.A10]|nr:hypothetical protein NVP1022O_66 [Vibrio phage 1.022.O._10N.286.45.A10]
MFYDDAQQAFNNHPEATHILTTCPDWVEKGHSPKHQGKFVAVRDTGEQYIVLHTLDKRTRSIKYTYDWIVAEVRHG